MGRVGFFHGFNRPRDVYPSRGRSNFNPPFDPVTALSHIEIVIDFAEYTSLARSPFHLDLGLLGRYSCDREDRKEGIVLLRGFDGSPRFSLPSSFPRMERLIDEWIGVDNVDVRFCRFTCS